MKKIITLIIISVTAFLISCKQLETSEVSSICEEKIEIVEDESPNEIGVSKYVRANNGGCGRSNDSSPCL